jgi:tRNA (mo5U34)-methyltransferase
MGKARNEIVTAETQKLVENLSSLGWYHSLRLPDGELIPGIQSEAQLRWRIEQFPIPEDLTGMRVLDIGAWDGWFTFEMERRGASVVAVDVVDQGKFRKAKELLGSRAEYYIDDVLQLTPEKYGYFDIVLFFGVLYHLKHPLLALERVCELSTNMVCVESFVSDERLDAPPVMEFYEHTDLCGQFDNWVGPNLSCLMAFCRTVGFAEVQFNSTRDNRAHVTGFRKWPDRPRPAEAPLLLCVENSVSRDHSFSRLRDDYVSIWFKTDATDLTSDNVYPQIGRFGVRPSSVHSTGGDGWHANFKLPPGLRDGIHEVSVAIRDSGWSNKVRIPVGVPDEPARTGAVTNAVDIAIVTDGRTWERNMVHRGANSCISLWVRGLESRVPVSAITVRLNGGDHPASYVSQPDPEGLTQINAVLPVGMAAGPYKVAVAIDATESAARDVELV